MKRAYWTSTFFCLMMVVAACAPAQAPAPAPGAGVLPDLKGRMIKPQ